MRDPADAAKPAGDQGRVENEFPPGFFRDGMTGTKDFLTSHKLESL
jgi:hypothetical protein